LTRRLKVGVLGAGIGKLHIDAYRELPDLYEVAAIADLDGAKASTVARDGGVPRVVADLGALLALDIDIVDICTPSALHFDHARSVLAAGKHALVEKPVAASLAEIDQLKEIEAASPGRLSPIFQYRFGGGLRRLQRLMDAAIVGKPYVATVETHWLRTAAYYREAPWRGMWKGALGGCLITHAIHAHDILTQVLGPVASVFARLATRVNPVETEDCAAITLQMQNGALATLSVTLGSVDEISRLRFCFEGLTVQSKLTPYLPASDPWTFTAGKSLQNRIDEALRDFAPEPEGFAGQFARLHAALVGGAPLPVTLDDSRASLELLSAAYLSARTDAMVRLPLVPTDPIYRGWLPD
jgi:predicted dehydrogenase